jgi:glycosyltransferase involved in cell wall biosynthesis
MRVLYCSQDYSPHDHRFLTALHESDHEIFWVRLEKGGIVQESRSYPGDIQPILLRKHPGKLSWSSYLELNSRFQWIVREIKPNLVHAGPVQRVAFIPALSGFHPLLTMSWGFDLMQDANRDPIWRWVTRYVLERSDWFIADCQAVLKKARQFGLTHQNVTIFPWGVDLEVFNPKRRGPMRRQVGYEEDLLILHTRSWESRYGVDVSLRGFWLALQQAPNLRMFMLGGGSQEREVRQFVEAKGLADRILFYGYHENNSLAKYYQAVDLYLSASHIDGSSVALLEAMACGCPALVSNIPSNLEWVEDGSNGFVFADNNAEELAAKLVFSAKNKEKLIRMGKQAYQKIIEKADWRKSVQVLMDTYQRLCDETY